jgi:hypothetical protein
MMKHVWLSSRASGGFAQEPNLTGVKQRFADLDFINCFVAKLKESEFMQNTVYNMDWDINMDFIKQNYWDPRDDKSEQDY